MQTKQANFEMRKLNGDVLTPINIFLRREGTKKFILESSRKHSEQGRYSFIGVNPVMEIIGERNKASVISSSGVKEQTGVPLDIMQASLPRLDLELPFPFYGGAVGYVGYDAIRQYVDIGEELKDEINMPDIHFMVYEDAIVYDHLAQSIYVLAIDLHGNRTEEELEKRMNELEKQISRKEQDETLTDCKIEFTPQLEKEEFIRKVEAAQEFIKNGEIEQVVLSQRMI